MKPTVIILGTDALDIERTVDSIRADSASSEAHVLVRHPTDPEPWSQTNDGGVLLMRAGDRLCKGGAAALGRGLQDADVVLGGHRIAGAGHWALDILPPSIDDIAALSKWAVAPPFELSAIALRRTVLSAPLHPAPFMPGGELALLHAALTSTQNVRVKSIHDVVAEVRIRPEHAGDPGAILERLRGVLVGPLGGDPITASRVRRRALSLAYLESGPPLAGQFDADIWWGQAIAGSEDVGALAIVQDLHWVLTCLADAKRIAELGLDGLARTAPSDSTADLPPNPSNLMGTIQSLHLLIEELSSTIVWLHEEVQNRENQLAIARPASGRQLVEETRAVDLARVVLHRAANRVGRLVKRGAR